MKSKRKLLISMLAIMFVLLAVVATVAIAFALTQQTIKTTLNIGYTVKDIEGTASATYTVGGVTESLTAKKGDHVIGDTLYFYATDTEDAGNLMFPEGQIGLDKDRDNIVIQYTYSNTGDRHYMASLSFDSELKSQNMKVEYGIWDDVEDTVVYSESRYAMVVPANTLNKSYWIRISIVNKAKNASFTGDFNWLLEGCDDSSDSYYSLDSLTLSGSEGAYSAAYNGSDLVNGALYIPNEINGSPVTSVKQYGYAGGQAEQKEKVKSVVLAEGITEIGEHAFYKYTNLETLTLPESLTTIGQNALFGCSSLSRVNVADANKYATVTMANQYSNPSYICDDFYENGELIKDLYLNNIDVKNGFKNAGCIESVTFGSGVTSIAADSFSNCNNLKLINFNATNCTTATGAFSGVNSECKLVVGGNVTKVPSQLCGNANIKEAVIGDNVTIIGGSAFINCKNLQTVTIGSGVQVSEWYAFNGCTAISRVNIKDANQFAQITFNPNDQTANPVYYAKNIYLNDVLLENLVLDTATSVSTNAFINATCLKTLEIGDTVETIGVQAFNSCSGLTTISIGTGLTTIGNNAFAGCTGLTRVDIKDINQYASISGDHPIRHATNGNLYLNGNLVEDITLDVETVQGGAFVGVKSLKSVIFGSNVKTISASFRECSNLVSVTFNEGLEDIHANAFENTGLTSITLPSTIIKIRSWAFRGTKLSTVYIPASAAYIGWDTFKTDYITSIEFENQDGWYLGTNGSESTREESEAVDVSDATFNATQMNSFDVKTYYLTRPCP